MSRKFYVSVTLVALLGIGGWAIAEQQGEPAAKAPAAAENTAFVVSPAGQSAVMLNARSGESWSLETSYDGQRVWVPIKRLATAVEGQDWRRMQQMMGQELEERKLKLEEERRKQAEDAVKAQSR